MLMDQMKRLGLSVDELSKSFKGVEEDLTWFKIIARRNEI